MSKLTQAQKAENSRTWRHIHRVQHYMQFIIGGLIERAHMHDQSKLQSPEVEMFTEMNGGGALSALTYGSEEYEQQRQKMLQAALGHHYENNRHHPEHHENGVDDMTLLDLVEMMCDWLAAVERHNDGDIMKSIEYNSEKRFNISPQLRRILENTVHELR